MLHDFARNLENAVLVLYDFFSTILEQRILLGGFGKSQVLNSSEARAYFTHLPVGRGFSAKP